jgi:cytochrome c oxidase subunit IV
MAEKHTAHDAHHHANGSAHGHISKRTYYIVFALLMVLMVLTVGVYYLESEVLEPAGIMLPGVLIVGIAMSIAIAKTALIVLYFMHVKVSSKITQVFAAASFIWLLLLFGITMADYLARDWPGPADGPLAIVRMLM